MIFRSIAFLAMVVSLVSFGAVSAQAQLMQKKATAADSVDLSGGVKNRPLVYSDSASLRNERAAADAKAAMNLEYSDDSTMGTVIGVGAEFVGQTMKNMLSPNSAEADAVELERTRR